jgi:hypothetical protein
LLTWTISIIASALRNREPPLLLQSLEFLNDLAILLGEKQINGSINRIRFKSLIFLLA